MDEHKLVKKLALQVAEYNLQNIQLSLRIEELELEVERLNEQLWDLLPTDPPEAQAKRRSEKQMAHQIVNADRTIEARTLDGKSETIPGKSARECSCSWGIEGSKDEVEKAAAAHLFKVGAGNETQAREKRTRESGERAAKATRELIAQTSRGKSA